MMKNVYSSYLIVALLTMLVIDVAWARGGHHRHHHGHLNFGINIGGYNSGFYGPDFYQFRSFGYLAVSIFMMLHYRYVPRLRAPVIPPVYISA